MASKLEGTVKATPTKEPAKATEKPIVVKSVLSRRKPGQPSYPDLDKIPYEDQELLKGNLTEVGPDSVTVSAPTIADLNRKLNLVVALTLGDVEVVDKRSSREDEMGNLWDWSATIRRTGE